MKPLPILPAIALPMCLAQAATPRLEVSENKRCLVTEARPPFYWLAGTTWNLFNPTHSEEGIEECDTYRVVHALGCATFSVETGRLSNTKVKAWRSNRRESKAGVIGSIENMRVSVLIPPDAGEMLNRVLALDDAEKGCSMPGGMDWNSK